MSLGLGGGEWRRCRAQVVVPAPECWNGLEGDPLPPSECGKCLWVTPPSLARPFFSLHPCWGCGGAKQWVGSGWELVVLDDPGFKFQCCHFLTVCSWLGAFASLSLGSAIRKMGLRECLWLGET